MRQGRAWFKSRTFRVGVVLVLMAGIGAYLSLRSAPPPPLPPTGEAKTADVVQTVQAAGVLQPKVKVDVGAQVSGQVRRIHVQLGQQVHKGDVLVSLDPELARNDVAQAEAALAQQAALMMSRTKSKSSLARNEYSAF